MLSGTQLTVKEAGRPGPGRSGAQPERRRRRQPLGLGHSGNCETCHGSRRRPGPAATMRSGRVTDSDESDRDSDSESVRVKVTV